ncbi:MAG TPA: TetR/AcrR family transcriptional regulator [Myxococcota bacterium]|nr:TetR/AcrR family transcriptional regulator [Myxococcota bacterium]
MTKTAHTMPLEPAPAPIAGSGPSRRDRKKERTRREIYEAAMRLFARAGFGAVTIADICEEADVGRGTFFLHFPSKAALLYEFNQRVAEEFRASLIEPRAPAREELCALVERMSVELVAQAEIMTAMLAEFFASPEALAAVSAQGSALPELVTDIIRRGQERGEFGRRIDARLAAASFLATAAAIISGQVFRGGDVVPEEVNRQFLQITFSGLDPAGDRSG